MSTQWLYAIPIALYGLLFGSFYNVVGTRVPKGESIATPPSHCDACGARLRWFDLVPVASWAALGGRCRTCRAAIPVAYPLVELMTAVFLVLEWLHYGLSAEFVIGAFCVSALAVLSAADFAYHRLPDAILLPATAVLMALRAFFHPLGVSSYLTGAAVGFALLLLVRIVSRGGMGFGDVKLFVFVGLFVGLAGVVLTLVLASFLGTVAGVSLRLMGRLKAKEKIAFGPAIAAAAVWTHMYGAYWIAAYLATLR